MHSIKLTLAAEGARSDQKNQFVPLRHVTTLTPPALEENRSCDPHILYAGALDRIRRDLFSDPDEKNG